MTAIELGTLAGRRTLTTGGLGMIVRRLLAGLRTEILIAGLVAQVEQEAPDEVGGESTQQNNNQHRQPGPQTVLGMDGDKIRTAFRHRQRGFLFRQSAHFLDDFELLGICRNSC